MKGGLQIKMNSKKDITLEIKFDLKQMLGSSASDNQQLLVDELLNQVYYNLKRLQRTVLTVLESERGKSFKLSANLNLIESLGLKGKSKLIPPQGAVPDRVDSTSQTMQIEAPANQPASNRSDCAKKMTAQVVTELDRNWHLMVSLTFSLFDLNRLFPISSMTQLRLKMSNCVMERPPYQQPIVVRAEMEEWPFYGFSAPLDLGELMFYTVPMLVDAGEVGEPLTIVNAVESEESGTKGSWARGRLSLSCRGERLVSAPPTGTASETPPDAPSFRPTDDREKADRIANSVSPLHIVGGAALEQLLQNVESSRCDTDDDRTTDVEELTEPAVSADRPNEESDRVVPVADASTSIGTEAGKSRIPIYARPGTTGSSARVADVVVHPELDTNGNPPAAGTGAPLTSEPDPVPKRAAQIPRAAKLAAAGRIQSEDSKRSKRTRSGGNANESQKMRKLGASKQQQGGGGSKLATKGCKRPTERANLADSAGGAKPNKTASSRYKR